MNPQIDYTYETAGFDGFLSRSIDGVVQANLASPGPPSMAIRYDGAQVTGVIGDTFRTGNVGQVGDWTGDIRLKGTLSIGDITLDGENNKIGMVDTNNKEFLSFRVFPGGTRGFIITKSGFSINDVIN